MDKYEYLTDKDLGYKPEKARFEYGLLGQVLDKNERQEGLLKRLKNKTLIVN